MKKECVYTFGSKKIIIVFCFTKDEKNLMSIGTGKNESSIVPASIQYVHQLQNIFYALTGEELAEIKEAH